MQLDSDDLLARIRQDYPLEFELSELRLLTEKQAAEIARLTAPAAGSNYSASVARPYVLDDQEPRHG